MLNVKSKQDTGLFAEGMLNVKAGGSSTAREGPDLGLTAGD